MSATGKVIIELEEQIAKLQEMLATKNHYPVFIVAGGHPSKGCFSPEVDQQFDTLGAGIATYVKSEEHPLFGTCHTWKLQCGSMFRTDSFGFHRFRNTNDEFNIIGRHHAEGSETDCSSHSAVETP